MSETVMAFDFGGTWLKVAEVDRSGKVLWDDRVHPTGEYRKDMEAVDRLAGRRSPDVVAGCVASAGPLDFHTGEVLTAFNINWINVFPGRDLADMLRVPITTENDADCAALAEAVYGGGRDAVLLVFYGLGTGVGSGVIEDKRIFHGAFDPEFGHQIIDLSVERYCKANHRGCLEALVSGGALERAFGSIEAVPDEQWTDVIPHYLGQALTNAALFLSPDVIVVGGGVVDHRPDIVPPAIDEMERLLNDFVMLPRVVVSQLGREVGLLGAAAAAWAYHDETLGVA